MIKWYSIFFSFASDRALCSWQEQACADASFLSPRSGVYLATLANVRRPKAGFPQRQPAEASCQPQAKYKVYFFLSPVWSSMVVHNREKKEE